MNHHNKPISAELEQRKVHTLAAHAANRAPGSVRNLRKENDKTGYQDQLAKEPLVKKETHGGNVEEGLTHLIITGSTVLGVSREINKKKIGSDSNPVERVRVAVLPLGTFGGDFGSSRTLLDVRLAELRQPRDDGAVKPWEVVEIGRKQLADKTGIDDPHVSGAHLAIAISEGGSMAVKDLDSTNGTQVLSIEDFYNQQGRGLDDTGRLALFDVVDQLQQNPHMWDGESADRRVINPYE